MVRMSMARLGSDNHTLPHHLHKGLCCAWRAHRLLMPPHTFVRSPRLRLGEFVISNAKGLFRQHRSKRELAMRPLKVRWIPHNGHDRRCRNHELSTGSLTHIKCGFMVCILYVQNGGDMTVYGYARVSTDGQSLSAQLAELKAAKCAEIFREKISGARSDRKHLARLMSGLAKGDVLIVTRLDRLARSTRDLLNLLGTIAEKGAGFKSLRGLGRYHDGAWPIDADRFGWSRRVRARTNPNADRRRA